MLHTYLAVPFASPTRQQQFEAVATALQADTTAPYTLLLGNIAPGDASLAQLDAVVIRPRSITILQLLPTGGQLHIPDLRTGTWLLDGAPLELPDNAENPFVRFEHQRLALLDWLGPHLPSEVANLQFTTGLVLFGASVQFGPEVEARMAAVPAASTFHLLANPARFTRRLAQLATPEIDLTPADLDQLAVALQLTPSDDSAPNAISTSSGVPTAPSALLRHKAGQLWRWLGAEDVDEMDRRTSGYEIDLEARNQEKQALEKMRTSLQADLTNQLHAMEAREAERERRISRLQQQLAAAPVAAEAPDLQAQLAAEKRDKAALEASIEGYRTELEHRNQELGTKIQQLENLIQRLSVAPTVLPPGSTATLPPSVAAAHLPSSDIPNRSISPVTAPVPSSAPTPPQREQFGRPASAKTSFLAGLARFRPVLRRLSAQLSPRVSHLKSTIQEQPRRTTYLTAGAAVLLLAVGIARCASTPDEPVPFQQNGRYGLLSTDGDTLAPAQYASISAFQERRAIVERDGVFGFVQDDGQEVIKPAYDALFPYTGDYARARVGQLYTFLDKDGEEFGAYYYAARDFHEGYAAVLDHRGWYYLTGPTEPASDPILFQEAYSFAKELARVKTGGQFTFIRPEYLADTTTGTAPFGRYASATDFDENGRARVRQHGRSFFINLKGEEVKN